MGKPVWTAEIEVDAVLVERLVGSQFPELANRSVTAFGVGWDNAAFQIDGHLVFRFPRRQIAAKLIEREAAILPAIAPRLPLAIPAPTFVGRSSALYPWAFAGYELIAGTTACSRALSREARERLSEPLARFLRALHDIDPAPFVAAGLPPDEIGRFDSARMVRATRDRLPTLIAAGVSEAAELLAWLEQTAPTPIPEDDRRLVHGDLYARHIVVDSDGNVTGIIDWGDVHLGDPAIDIAVAHLMLPESAYTAFRAAYGPIDERTWNAARYRALYHALLEVEYGERVGDGGMRAAGLTALQLMYPAGTR